MATAPHKDMGGALHVVGFFINTDDVRRMQALTSRALGNTRSQVAWATPAWPPGMKA